MAKKVNLKTSSFRLMQAKWTGEKVTTMYTSQRRLFFKFVEIPFLSLKAFKGKQI